jgi:hypothetical protein
MDRLGRNVTFVFEQKNQAGGRPGLQPGFVQYIAEGYTETAIDKRGIDFLEKGKVNMTMHGGRRIMQQIILSDFGIAKKGFEYRVVRFILILGTGAFFF